MRKTKFLLGFAIAFLVMTINPGNAFAQEDEYENGFHKTTGKYQPANFKGSAYEISNAGQLFWFAELVNTTATDVFDRKYYPNSETNAILTADIMVNDTLNWNLWDDDTKGLKDWISIGSASNLYKGNFNGNGHTIAGLYQKSKDNNVGLIATASGSISNLGIIKSYIKGNEYVGGICGNGGEYSNCYNTAKVTGTAHVGGICGYGGKYTNCYNTGTIKGDNFVGGICGFGGKKENTITNCYNTGKISGSSQFGDLYGSDCVVTNSYYLSKESNFDGGKTANQFKSGEVAYLLNENRSEGTSSNPLAWYQNLATNGDTVPVLVKTEATVVYYGFTNCDATEKIYSNTKLNETMGHNYVADTDSEGNAKWDWKSDKSEATLNLICLYNGEHKDKIVANGTNITDKEIKESGCTTDGISRYYATLTYNGNSYIDSTDVTVTALGHTEVTDMSVEPGCTTPGYEEGTHCSVCKKVLVAQKKIDPLGHDFSEKNLTTSADANGLYSYVCKHDAEHKSENKVIKEYNGVDNLELIYDNTASYENNLYVEELQLTDKKVLNIPYSFTAKKVTYDRKSEKDTMTIIFPCNVPIGSVNGKVYQFASFDGKALRYNKVETTLQANTPYLIYKKERTAEDKAMQLISTLENVTVYPTSDTVEITVAKATQFGSYGREKYDVATSEYDYYGYKDGKFKKAGDDLTMSPYRAAIKLLKPITKSTRLNGNNELNIVFEDDEVVTGVEVIDAVSEFGDKVNVYDIAGRAIRLNVAIEEAFEGLKDGVYIVNGKKVLVSEK